MKTTAFSMIFIIAILNFVYRVNCPEFKDINDLSKMETFICMLRDLNQPDDPPRVYENYNINLSLSALSSSATVSTGTAIPSPSLPPDDLFS